MFQLRILFIFSCALPLFSFPSPSLLPSHIPYVQLSCLAQLLILCFPAALNSLATAQRFHPLETIIIWAYLLQCPWRAHYPNQLSLGKCAWWYTHANFPLKLANELFSNLEPSDILVDGNPSTFWNNWCKAFLDIMHRCLPNATLPNRRNLSCIYSYPRKSSS